MTQPFGGKNQSRAKRKRYNMESCTKRLQDENIDFVTNNNGMHLVVNIGGTWENIVDYWPTTGRWIVRKSNLNGRGVESLLIHIKSYE